MSLTRNQQQAMARLQHLACLDVTGPQLIEPVLHELRRVIAFDTGIYFHPDADGALDAYIEPSIAREWIHRYFDPQMAGLEQEVVHHSARDFATAVRMQHGALAMAQLISVSRNDFIRSRYYNEISRPAQVLDYLSLVLRTPQGVGVGAVKLCRRPDAPPFTPEEAALLTPLEPWLARILQPGELDAQGSVVCASAMLVATPEGRMLWTSPEADALLALAFGPRWYRRGELPPALQLLLVRLRHLKLGTALPQLDLSNASGTFSLRATQMSDPKGQSQSVGIHITQRIPRAAQLLPALRALQLPQRQHELAYWLARGLPEDEIASRMGISANTTVYHRREVYARLGVRNRQELQALLFAPGLAG